MAGHSDMAPEGKKEKSTGEVTKNGSCSCQDEAKSGAKFTPRDEEERIENILFENELQNVVSPRY